jgi:plastocyanin
MRKFMAAVTVFGFACGGGESESASSTPAVPSQSAEVQAEAAAPAEMGTVHEVSMKLTSDGRYVFEPAAITIKVGDTVRWLNESGPPHNVAFDENAIPGGAEAFLTQQFAGDAQKMGPMAGRLMTQIGDTYEITFAGAPTGTYNYFCTPHLALGMKATLTVEE